MSEQEYNERVDRAVTSQDIEQLKQVVREVVDLPSVATVGRHVLEYMASKIVGTASGGGIRDNNQLRDLTTESLRLIHPHATSLASADWALRKVMYDVAEDNIEAARAFVDAANIPEEDRPFAYVRIAQNFLEVDDDGNADVWIRKAADIIDSAPWEVMLQYQVCRAQVADARRNFTQAAQLYLNISQQQNDAVREEQLVTLLNNAAACIILERAGPQRQRLMGKILKDSRANQLECGYLLEKMYMDRIITADEARRFEATLKPHQLAFCMGSVLIMQRLKDGSTVLERAVREHNLFAVSKVYHNISFDSLGQMLRLTPAQAERVAAEMIASERLVASIDQVDGALLFASAGDTLASWDRRLREICMDVSSVTEAVLNDHPELEEADGSGTAS